MGLLTALLYAQIFGAIRTVRMQWEYTIVSPSDVSLETQLERLGADGWEIVFARRASYGLTDSMRYELILKRPKR